MPVVPASDPDGAYFVKNIIVNISFQLGLFPLSLRILAIA
jgi:hypothetical protein